MLIAVSGSFFLFGCSLKEEKPELNVDEIRIETIQETDEEANLETEEQELEDMDGNGQNEKVIYSGNEGFYDKLAFYFNGEKIYERDGSDTLPADIGEFMAYEDIDHDGAEEIILTMYPYVNSMPLTEYTVLKNKNGRWEELEVYRGKDILDNTFPISVTKGKNPYEAVITCAGSDREFSIDVEKFYAPYKESLTNQGEECGGALAWGVWDIQLDELGGKPCLVATQGIGGYDQKFDYWGNIDIYFDYDRNGKIQIRDLKFSENDTSTY